MTRDLSLYKHLRGIERESLRIIKNGHISNEKHSTLLGSKLCNKNITVDFSENLLEMITDPLLSITNTLDQLRYISSFCVKNISYNEYLLSTSMPLNINENDINIADFGYSNYAQLKKLYRQGLAKRYGKMMQIISGVHYNFSFNSYFLQNISIKNHMSINELYFSVINNYFEFMWLLPYLFGASPICCKHSISNKRKYLTDLNDDFYIGEYTTSIRLSKDGYSSKLQNNLHISFNNLNDYIKDLLNATKTLCIPFSKIGIFDKYGVRQQINDNILQIENEYYNSIRPKQLINNNERLLDALYNRGVQYLEIRALDNNPFSKIGISKNTCYFIEAMLMTCLLQPTKKYCKKNIRKCNYNFNKVAEEGRKPKVLLLSSDYKKVYLSDIGNKLMDLIESTAKSMGNKYYNSVLYQRKKIDDAEQTISARIIKYSYQSSYIKWVNDISQKHTLSLRNCKIPKNIKKY